MANVKKLKYEAMVVGGMDHDEAGRFAGFTAAMTHDTFEVTAKFRPVNGRPEPVEVTIKNGDGVSANRVRQLPLGDMLAEGRKAADRQAQILAAAQEQIAGQPAQAKRTRSAWADVGPQRGRPATTEELEHVAAVYREAWSKGESVTKAIKVAFGLTQSGAAKKIMVARKNGLLDGIGPR